MLAEAKAGDFYFGVPMLWRDWVLLLHLGSDQLPYLGSGRNFTPWVILAWILGWGLRLSAEAWSSSLGLLRAALTTTYCLSVVLIIPPTLYMWQVRVLKKNVSDIMPGSYTRGLFVKFLGID